MEGGGIALPTAPSTTMTDPFVHKYNLSYDATNNNLPLPPPPIAAHFQPPDDGRADLQEPVLLPRGGKVVQTCVGPVQFGIPPETIKDSMDLGMEVPSFYVVPSERFNRKLGPNCGINIAEFEFPAYFNYFLKRKRVHLIVNTLDAKERIKQVFQETLLGPEEWDPNVDFAVDYPEASKPDMMKEMHYFRKFGDKLIDVDMLLCFTVFDDNGIARVEDENGNRLTILQTLDEYILSENDVLTARVPTTVELPLPPVEPLSKTPFLPPLFAVTVLGSSHGFDPAGKTSGYVLWMNRRGIMIDPPPNSTTWLLQNNIPPSLIDGVIVTHCHADHDAGTFQKILQEGKISLYTTPTIMGCFLRKYAALSGLSEEFLGGVFKFHPVIIGSPIKIRGATFNFFYSLHSIPCIGFEVFFADKSIVFSADHMNDPTKIRELCANNVISDGRRDQLLAFPYHHDVILHEAGVPPIHTPLETLSSLPEDVKKRLYVVHVDAKKITPASGLRVAQPGVENTITLDVESPTHASAISILDLVSSVDIFSHLKLSHATEILTMAKHVFFKAGEAIVTKGELGDCFYVISSGVAEVVVYTRRRVGDGGSTATSYSSPSIRHRRILSQDTNASSSATGSDAEDDGEAGLSVTIKNFTVGDYFGEQALLSDTTCVRTADIFALTDLHAVKFSKADCLFMFNETGVLDRMSHLTNMRKEGVWGTMMCNSVLHQLTASQKTQLEGYFHRKEFAAGEIIWRKNTPPKFACLIQTGSLRFEGRVNVFRRNSGVHIDLKVRRAPVPSHFTTGAFMGDVDALVHQTRLGTTVVAIEDGIMNVIYIDDLIRFFSCNPGVLFSMLHTQFVV